MTSPRVRRLLTTTTAGLIPIALAAGVTPAHTPAAATDTTSPTVEPLLTAEIRTDGHATFWVYLDDEADLASAARMTDRRAQGRSVHHRLRETATTSQADLIDLLDHADADYESFWIANTVKVTGNADLLDQITALPHIDRITTDRRYELPDMAPTEAQPTSDGIEWGVERIGAPDVWDIHGVDGDGIVIGNIDTGVDFEHPALIDQYRGSNGDGTVTHDYNWWDPSNVCGDPSLVPCDNHGHGTHTMGTMVGDDGKGNRIGVAPGATWIAAKGCESVGLTGCSQSALLSAGQFMLAPTDLAGNNPNPDLRPHVVNNSWGGRPISDPWYEPMVQAWIAAGIFPQFSAGNDGPACQTVGNPGNMPSTYAAGAFDVDNAIADFSSRGSSAWGDAIKPNIAAPGVAIRSSLPGGVYGAASGTSMASPHVAGAVALMWSATEDLLRDVEATKAILDRSAIDVDDLTCGGTADNNNVWGQGRLDVFAAVNGSLPATLGRLEGTVSDIVTGDPIGGVTVDILGTVTRQRVTDADGRFAITVPSGDYQVTARATGYTDRVTTSTVVTDKTTQADLAMVIPDGKAVQLSATSVDFGTVPVATTSDPMRVTVTSVAADPVTITALPRERQGFSRSGGTCAEPITLTHLDECTIEFSYHPQALSGPVDTVVMMRTDAPGGPHDIALHAEATTLPALKRMDAIATEPGEHVFTAAVMHPDGDAMYFGTSTNPAQVVKIDPGTFERVGALTLTSDERNLTSAAIDPAGRYAYFGTTTYPARVVKVDLETFERVDAVALADGENNAEAALMDPEGRFLHIVTATNPGRLVTIDLQTFERVGAVTFDPGESFPRSAVIDPAGRFAYVGIGTYPGRIVKIDLASTERVSAITLSEGQNDPSAAIIDPTGDFAYFGTQTSPGQIVRIDLDTFAPAGTLVLNKEENSPRSALMDPAGEFAYFGTYTTPGRVVQVDLDTFERVDAITMNLGDSSLRSAVIDPNGVFAYFGAPVIPGQILKVRVATEFVVTADARRRRGDHLVDLTWTGGTADEVDVFRDGELVLTGPNGGAATDEIRPPGRRSYAYRVCRAGSCSDETVATFSTQP